MKRCLLVLLLSFAGVLPAQQGTPRHAVPPKEPAVELKGKIERVQAARGQGMPRLEVKQGSRTVVVLLGSMRYLIEQDFNPKVGEDVEVKGYRAGDEVIAATVRLPAQGKTIRLRDENGRPVWMRGRR
jgi:hypothetical protein